MRVDTKLYWYSQKYRPSMKSKAGQSEFGFEHRAADPRFRGDDGSVAKRMFEPLTCF